MLKINLLFSCILTFSLLSACFPAPPSPSLESPAPLTPDELLTMTAPLIPYMPANIQSQHHWPSRPITIIVPFLAGDDTDLFARMLAPFLADTLGQPIYVINIDGSSGVLGTECASQTTPDGYTVLFHHAGGLLTNFLAGTTELNHNDFEIACFAMNCYASVLAIRSDIGIECAESFLAYMRANPKELSVASVNYGMSFILLRLAESIAGFSSNNINVGAGGMISPAILAGYADLGYIHLPQALPHIESGKLTPLWIAASERNPLLPDVPTMAEIGINSAYIGGAYLFAFPKNTDEAILRRMSDAVGQITNSPNFRRQLYSTVGNAGVFVPFSEADTYIGKIWDQLYSFGDDIR